MAVFCLTYYVIICLAMGKWNSTFALFWPVAGAGCMLLHLAVRLGPQWLMVAVHCMISIAFFVFAAVEIRIFLEMRKKQDVSCDYIIILGAQICGNKVTDSLRKRLDAGIRYLASHPDTKVIVSGGRGTGEDITEAKAMRDYLLAKGVCMERILLEERSASTKENFAFSMPLIQDAGGTVGIVTNNFHMYRAVCWARKTGLERLHTIPAGCHPVLFLNYITREFFGVWKLWLLE